MKKRFIAIGLLMAVATLGITSCSKEPVTSQQPGKQTYCPVMEDNPINPDLYVDVEGKRIYVCCPGCIATVKADPEKYIRQMEAEGVVLEDAPE